jgi:hypothetical protein
MAKEQSIASSRGLVMVFMLYPIKIALKIHPKYPRSRGVLQMRADGNVGGSMTPLSLLA